ncbi:putative arylesterase monooxygenase protein [Rosellinia necatrix]|uniref:Putative arylesterase monooxygenase protein n=1 Tax=Rosellinia necatrix TaxID=77044 RepID=A0A1S7UJA6_ROSNE|nr:putative arylesterase monooxygenase protein [Rosellinia necatrix]
MSAIKLDPEWKALWDVFSLMPKPVINDVYDLRKAANIGLAASSASLPERPEIKETKHSVTSLDGTDIDVHQFVPPAAASDPSPQRAILFAFGGGMIAGNIDIWRTSIGDLAHRAGSQVFAVNYRLAPEHPAPAAVEDFYAAARWLQARAADFGVDPARVVLHGKSAGGGIAAGAALLARDRGELPHPLAAMSLVYPMLDDRSALPEGHPMEEYLVWTSRGSDLAWTALLGRGKDDRTDENVSIYAVPARAKDLSGLPDTYIDVGALDLFRDEDIEFARRLAAEGVYVEFHLYPGVAHGFDSLRNMQVAQQAISGQTRFLTNY